MAIHCELHFYLKETSEYNLVKEGKKSTKCGEGKITSSKNENEESCKQMCTENEKCRFLFININGLCSLHETCNDLKKSTASAKLFEKTKGERYVKIG